MYSLEVDTGYTQRILFEAKSLALILGCIEGLEDPSYAREAVRQAQESQVIEDWDSFVVRAAMEEILDLPQRSSNPYTKRGGSPERVAFEALTEAWLLWVSGEDPSSIQEGLGNSLELPLFSQEGSSSLHRMTLRFFYRGIQSLLEDDLPESHRFFRRSVTLGSQLGTPTNSVIQWIYAASFFEG